MVVLDPRRVGILWETGRLVERGLDRGDFVFGHDALSGHGPAAYPPKSIEIPSRAADALPRGRQAFDRFGFFRQSRGFPDACVGKLGQAAIGNPLKMMDVGSLSGDPTPG